MPFLQTPSNSSTYFLTNFVYTKDKIRFETIEKNTGISVTVSQGHPSPWNVDQWARPNTAAVSGGELYSAELYFEVVEGEKVLKIDARTWEKYANFSAHEESFTASRFLESIGKTEDLQKLIEMLALLAQDNGVQIPKELIYCDLKQSPDSDAYKIEMPILAYLMYPMIRESGSLSIAKNYFRFEAVWQELGPLNYKKLVQKAFGTSTPKLLKSLWEAIVVGKERELYAVSAPISPATAGALPTNVEYSKAKGTKAFDMWFFNGALNVFKAFGFDYLYQFLEQAKISQRVAHEGESFIYGNYRTDPRDLVALSSYFSKRKLIKILANGFNSFEISDTVEMIKQVTAKDFIPPALVPVFGSSYKVPKCNSITELHNKLSSVITTVNAEKNKKPIPLYDWEEKLDGLTRGDLKFIVARKTETLADWGAKLKNCIASYNKKALNKESTLVGIERDGKLTYAMELKPMGPVWERAGTSEREEGAPQIGDGRAIAQLVGYGNGRLSKEEFSNISDAIYKWYFEFNNNKYLYR